MCSILIGAVVSVVYQQQVDKIIVSTDTISLISSGATWNKYYNSSSDEYTLSAHLNSINYLNNVNKYVPINATIELLPKNHLAREYEYVTGNEKGLYSVYFKQDAQSNYPICLEYNHNVLCSKLMGIGYYDPSTNHNYTILQTVQNVSCVNTGNSNMYRDILSGVDAEWVYEENGLKENIIISNTTKALLQNNPPSDYGYSNQDSYVVFVTKLDYENAYCYDGDTKITGNFTFLGDIIFKGADGDEIFTIADGYAYEQNNETNTENLIYRLIQYNGEYYILSGMKVTTLNSMDFPVVFDPSTNINSATTDGMIYRKSGLLGTWGNTRGAPTGDTCDTSSVSLATMSSVKVTMELLVKTYHIYRSFFDFDTSSLDDSATITGTSLFIRGYNSNSADVIVIQSSQGVSLTVADFDATDWTAYSSEKTGWSTAGWNEMVLNTAGENAVSLTGHTYMALVQYDNDYLDSEPASAMDEKAGGYYADHGTNKPYLNITYTLPDTTAPTPNPATWSVEPAEDSSSSISMTATTASDSTPPIFTKFWETTGNTGGTTSSWQSADYTYTDTGLSENQIYTYKCQYKDSVATSNIGTNSSTSSDYTDIDPPLSSDFDLGTTITYNSIAMSIDPLPPRSTAGSTGVYFDFVSGGTGAGDQAFSQTYTYTDSGLEENEPYTYRAKFRNGDGNDDNEYCSNEEVYTYCQKPEDTDVTFSGYGTNWINVSVAQCNNPTSGNTDCYIDCISGGASDAGYADTGWLTDHWYYNFTSLSSNTEYCFKAKFRNYDSVETTLSTTAQCQTSSNNVPTQSGEVPANSSTGISASPSLHVICTDADSDTMTATWWSNSSGSWIAFATNNTISTGTNITQTNSNFSVLSTTYYWSVNLTDDIDWCNKTYHFTIVEILSLRNSSCEPTSGVASYDTFYFNITWADSSGKDPTDGYLNVSINRSGWSTNQSLTYVSGNNLSGAIYTYSTTLSAGSYNYTFYGYNGIMYNTSGPHVNPTVSSQSLSFTVVTSSAGDYVHFNDWTLTLTGVGYTTEYNVSEDNQTGSVPAFNISNTGNVPLNFSMNWTGNPGSGISMKWNTTNNAPTHGVNEIAEHPASTQIITNLINGSYEHIWLWMDFVSVTAQTSQQTVKLWSELYT